MTAEVAEAVEAVEAAAAAVDLYSYGCWILAIQLLLHLAERLPLTRQLEYELKFEETLDQSVPVGLLCQPPMH